MKLTISKYKSDNEQHNNTYCIDLNNGYWVDTYIANCLGFKLDDYVNILTKYNAFYISELAAHYFKNKEDAELVFEELESYLIMKILTN